MVTAEGNGEGDQEADDIGGKGGQEVRIQQGDGNPGMGRRGDGADHGEPARHAGLGDNLAPGSLVHLEGAFFFFGFLPSITSWTR